jgi:hypothetical protein
VVRVKEKVVGAGRKSTSTIANGERARQGRRDGPAAAPEVEPGPVIGRVGGDQRGITGQAAKRFRGDTGPVVQRGGQAARGQGILLDMNDDLRPRAARPAVVVSEVCLRDGDQRVDRRGEPSSRLRGRPSVRDAP